MAIDEALSKGLKKQLIIMWNDEIKSAFDKFKKIAPKIDLRSRNNFPKFINAHRDCFKRVSIAYVVGGSSRKPFIGMIALHPDEKKYLDRIEHGVIGVVDALNLTEFDNYGDTRLGRSTFFISEHAVARAYQRSLDTNENEVLDPYVIINEFSYIPLWSSFWSETLSEGHDPFADQEICPINLMIPAPNGVFLCKVSKHGPSGKFKLVEIRTYVQNEKLSESQKSLREFLLDISKNLENSVICLFPNYVLFQANQKDMESEALLVRSLLKLKLRTRVKEISTGFVSDDYMAYKLSEALIGYFKINFSDQTIKHFDSILQKLNYAAFSDEFRRIKQISKRINKA